MTDVDRLLAYLEPRYRAATRASRRAHARALRSMVMGGSHTLRLHAPYPLAVRGAAGAVIRDADGRSYIDYWQGHFANILGHNPRGLGLGPGPGSLHTGFEAESQVLLAELLLKLAGWPGHKVRFTTSGTLATMSAVALAQGATGREAVLKVGGGWHGASPFLLRGVRFDPRTGYAAAATAGLPEAVRRKILVTRFNDPDDLERIFKARGEKIAAFIVEPFLGAGGFLPASAEYLGLARRLTERHGALLVLDEVVSGFRFGPFGLQKLFGLEPDLTTYGKIIGGGHAVAAVSGKAAILDRVRTGVPPECRVLFEGGTFSAHDRYMRAGRAVLGRLAGRAGEIYPRLAALGGRLRRGIEAAFREAGIEAVCTGAGAGPVPDGSLVMTHFPLGRFEIRRPEDLWDPERCDVRLREEGLKLALLLEGVHIVHGGGAISAAHGERHIDRTIEACASAARLIKRFVR